MPLSWDYVLFYFFIFINSSTLITIVFPEYHERLAMLDLGFVVFYSWKGLFLDFLFDNIYFWFSPWFKLLFSNINCSYFLFPFSFFPLFNFLEMHMVQLSIVLCSSVICFLYPQVIYNECSWQCKSV